ncbi:MAG: hypothetical protein ACK2U6_17830 [Candidatus Promineifilaceae bacterium]
MKGLRTSEQEASEDIFFGQLVIIYARWFVVIAMTILALWTSTTLNQMVIGIVLIVPLIALNFFVHGRYLMEKPANRLLLIMLGILDATVITLIIAFWPGAKGLYSQFYVFYYPIILAFAFVFPGRLSIIYTIFVLLLYSAICVLFSPEFLADMTEVERLSIRLITIAATGMIGVYYYRIQRSRRRRIYAPDLTPAELAEV